MNKFEVSQQFKSGAEVADFLDRYFSARGWDIRPTTPHEERSLCLGDRHYRKDDEAYTVEYKSGIQTFYTGNIFLETVSVDTEDKPGWVYTCQADFIFYGALLNDRILIFKPSILRNQIDFLKQRFKEVSTRNGQNEGYNTHGLIVPLAYAEQHIASKVITLVDTHTGGSS